MHILTTATTLLATAHAAKFSARIEVPTDWTEFAAYDLAGNYSENAGKNNRVVGAGVLYVNQYVQDAVFFHDRDTIVFNEGEANVEFGAVTSTSRALCRLQGYLTHCNHPFTAYGGDPVSGTDWQHPVFLDFALIDVPPPPNVFQETHDLYMYPAVATGVVPIFNIPGLSRLVVSKSVLARMFRGCDDTLNPTTCPPGSITAWNHTDIKALNPASTWPLLDAAGPIHVIVRAEDNSGATLALKTTLAKWDAGFATQFDGHVASGDAVWPGPMAHVSTARLDTGMIAFITNTPGTLGYAVLSQVKLLRATELAICHDPSTPTLFVTASTDSVSQAVVARGLEYDLPTTDEAKAVADRVHTVDLTDSTGRTSWPLSFYTYLLYRSVNSRAGTLGHCDVRNTTLTFLTHLYDSEDVVAHSPLIGFASIFAEGRAQILDEIRHNFHCNPNVNGAEEEAQDLYRWPASKIEINVVGSEEVHDVMQLHAQAYQNLKPYSYFTYEPSQTARVLAERFNGRSSTSSGLVVLADENLSMDLSELASVSDDASFKLLNTPFVAMGLGFAYNLCDNNLDLCEYSNINLLLDVSTAAAMLNGDITHWNDSRIRETNPDVTLPNQPIHVVMGPDTSALHFLLVSKIRRCCLSDFAYAAPGRVMEATFVEQRATMFDTPYSFGFTPMNTSSGDTTLHMARLVNNVGEIAEPTYEAIEACATDTYDPVSNLFHLGASKHPACWPLTESITLWTMLQYNNQSAQCGTNKVAQETAYFVNYLLSGDEVNAPMRRVHLGALTGLSVTAGKTSQMRVDLEAANRDLVESMTCGGKSIVKVDHDLHLIPDPLIYFVYTLYALLMAFILSMAVWIAVNRNRKLVRNSSPAFMSQVLFGAAIQVSCVISLSQQDDWLVGRGIHPAELDELQNNFGLDVACMSEPILFSVGFFLCYSALFLKAWRLIRIFNNRKLRHLYVRDAQLFAYQTGVIVVVVALNLTWVLTDPLLWTRRPRRVNERSGLVVESVGLCNSTTAVSAVPLLLGVFAVLILGNYLSYLGRHVPTEFNESRWTAMAMVVNLEAILLGLPVLVLANDDPVTGYVIKVFITLLTAGATVGLVFIPKLALAYGWFAQPGTTDAWRFVKGSSSDERNGNSSVKRAPSKNAGAVAAGAVAVVSSAGIEATGGGVTSTNPALRGPTSTAKMPSLASLVEGEFTSPAMSGGRSGVVMQAPGGSTAAGQQKALALAHVLEEDPLRRRFRRFLATQKADENLRFWDAVEAFQKEPEQKRVSSARSICLYFIVDSAPKQINLKAPTRAKLLDALKQDNRGALGAVTFFDEAMEEVFNDLKQSDAFQQYLNGGGATSVDVGSDVSLN